MRRIPLATLLIVSVTGCPGGEPGPTPGPAANAPPQQLGPTARARAVGPRGVLHGPAKAPKTPSQMEAEAGRRRGRAALRWVGWMWGEGVTVLHILQSPEERFSLAALLRPVPLPEHQKFRLLLPLVRPGMTPEQVRRVLGSPYLVLLLGPRGKALVIWHYSEPEVTVHFVAGRLTSVQKTKKVAPP